ncbi:patatin-like phospholipase RssA [Escherichia sp. TW09308]|nr:patatin-like phospholipase RssA [Escherichia sp. TW09308]
MRKIKIGLALGSGAARGWSHIGVINALKEMGIEIDIVAGCSIGSLVGAAYACDRLSALEEWVTSFSYWDVLRLMDLSWQRGGLLRGERVFNRYREIMPETEIENCSRRFAAVATNLSTGRELWFTEGDLHLAIRASCSIPGLMAPVAHNGYWLVDGAVVNPIPISLTRAMGADIVMAIEQEKGKLAGQVETLNGKLSELENLKSDLEKELLELKRPAGGAQNKLATEHKEAFVGFLRKGREDGLRDLERKALQVGTDEDGGYAVPEELDRNILNLLKDEVVMRQEATVITVGGSDYKKLVNLGGTASGWVGETDTRSKTATSRLELIEPLMGEIYGNPQATQKMLDDAFFNVEAWINSELATEFAEQEEIAFTSGDGTKKPKGFLAYESTDETDKVRAFGKLQHIVSGEATAVTADAIIKLIYTLRKAHRTGAKFMMNNNSLFAIRLLKDTEGNYLWRPGLELGQPSSLAGYGIAENEQMPDIAADAKAIAFGNFKRGYTIVDRIGTRILRDPYTNKPFVGFYTTKRTGGMLVDSQAIKLLKIAAA